ncbi:MAG: hypothetical protein R3236_05670, partial [Phycisphaeraceae bacterium]|nr:hypothetical protein [Phycisphaeraceae bacterium]
MKNGLFRTLLLVPVLTWAGCQKAPESSDQADGSQKKQRDHGQAASAGGVIDVPPMVRENLGIRFVKVIPRRVRQTLRLPGRFELLSTARHQYRGMLPGRVMLMVETLDRVEAGQKLATLESPDWRRMQHELSEAMVAIEAAKADARIAEAVIAENQAKIRLLEQRLDQLKKAGVRKIQLETQLAEAR